MKTRLPLVLVGLLALALVGSGWRMYVARISATSFYIPPAAIDRDLTAISALLVVTLAALIGFIRKRAASRFYVFVAAFCLFAILARRAVPDLLIYCMGPGVDCMPDPFDRRAGKLLALNTLVGYAWPLIFLLSAVGLTISIWPSRRNN